MVKAKCKRCSHEWEYKGYKNVTLCPFCRTSVKVQNLSIEELIKGKKGKLHLKEGKLTKCYT